MTEVLTQAEIDQLLTAIGGGDSGSSFESVEVFEKYLTERKYTPEKPYGIFDKDVSVCRFFSSGKNENLLEDIKRKNEAEGYGNITIPNTRIALINYSFCAQCKTVFSFRDITEYYMNPKPDPAYQNRAFQYRQDTRVYCTHCGAFFLPSLVIADGTPKNEVQFLCRAQTIDAVENFFFTKNIRVLTRKKENLVIRRFSGDDYRTSPQSGDANLITRRVSGDIATAGTLIERTSPQSGDPNLVERAIKNDVYIKDMEEKPTLITNMIQYTPFTSIMNLIDGTNVKKGDLLFNEWK